MRDCYENEVDFMDNIMPEIIQNDIDGIVKSFSQSEFADNVKKSYERLYEPKDLFEF